MVNEIGPENKISRPAAAGFAGRICPCCIAHDKKGHPLSFSFRFQGTKDSDWVKPIRRLQGRKGRTLRSHRKGA